MTKNLNKELKNYYSELGKSLSCDSKKKKMITARLKSDVECYLLTNPEATFDDIIKKFGSPQEMIEQYYDDEMAEQLAKTLSKGKKIALVVAVAATLLVIVLVCTIVSQLKTSVLYGEDNAAVTETDLSMVAEDISQN